MQEVIVYRNPVEAAVWNFLTSANGFVFMVGIVLAGIFSFISLFALERFCSWKTCQKYTIWCMISSAILAFYLVLKFM